ncbi:MAG: MFS transporter [Promethearchaeota archaeon]|jgi:predicted MFS family arabinose efflux permease
MEEYSKFSIEKDLKQFKINERRILFALKLSFFEDILGYSLIFPLLSPVARSLGSSDFFIGVMIAINALATLIFSPMWGKLSDKFGRKPFLIVSQFGTLAAFTLFAFSNSLEMILFTRILDGVFGGQMTIISSIISDITDPDTRSIKMADLMTINSFGLILGPLIGGVLGEISKLLINPNGIFFSSALSLPGYAAAGITVVAIILTFAVLKETMPKQRRAELARREEEKVKLRQTKSKLFTKEFLLRLLELFCQSMGTMMVFSSMSLILLDRYLLSEGFIGVIYAIIGVEMMLISRYGIRFLLKKFGDTKLLAFFTLMMVFVFLTFPFLYNVWLMILFIGPLILSMAILRPILIANTQKAAPPDRQGVASGWRVNTYAIASVIAPLVSTAFLDLQIGEQYFLGVKIAYYFMALASAFTLFIMYCLVKYDIRNFSSSFRKRTGFEGNPSKFKRTSEENQS